MRPVLDKAIVVSLVLTAVLALTPVAFAGQNAYAKAVVHVQVPPMSCPEIPVFHSCDDVNSTLYAQGDVIVIPVFLDLMNVTGAGIGLTWPPEWGSMIWTRCSGDGAVGSITNPGDGTMISWSACYAPESYSLAPGYGVLTVTSQGMVSPDFHFPGGDLGLYDCTPPSHGGPFFDYPMTVWSAGINMIGDDPCAPDATEQTTWGAIKALLR